MGYGKRSNKSNFEGAEMTNERAYTILSLTGGDVVYAMQAHSLIITHEEMEAITEHISDAIYAAVDYWELVREATKTVLEVK